MKLSLVIPVFNEQSRIKRGIDSAFDYLTRQTFSWELIIVDDGSTDKMAEVLSETINDQRSTSSRVHLLRTQRNFGKGHAIRVGVEAAEGDYIIFSDIDFSVPIEFTEEFLKALKKYDIAIGSRRLGESKVTKHQHQLRESLGQPHGDDTVVQQLGRLVVDHPRAHPIAIIRCPVRRRRRRRTPEHRPDERPLLVGQPVLALDPRTSHVVSRHHLD